MSSLSLSPVPVPSVLPHTSHIPYTPRPPRECTIQSHSRHWNPHASYLFIMHQRPEPFSSPCSHRHASRPMCIPEITSATFSSASICRSRDVIVAPPGPPEVSHALDATLEVATLEAVATSLPEEELREGPRAGERAEEMEAPGEESSIRRGEGRRQRPPRLPPGARCSSLAWLAWLQRGIPKRFYNILQSQEGEIGNNKMNNDLTSIW